MIVEDESFEIEKIISHNLVDGNLMYSVQLKDSDNVWLSSNYFNHYQCNLVEAYNTINDISVESIAQTPILDIKTEKIDESFELEDPTKTLAWQFNDQFRIKLECAMYEDDECEVINNVPELDCIQFGAAEFVFNETKHTNQKKVRPEIKTEKQDQHFTPETAPDSSTVSKIVSEVPQVSGSTITKHVKETSLHVLATETETERDKNKPNENRPEIGSSKKNITIGKVKKATKPNVELKTADEHKTVRSILLPSQISNTQDPFDKVFYNLPVFTKVVPPPPEINTDKLQQVTQNNFCKLFIEDNSLTLLQKYSQSDQRKNVEQLLKFNPQFLVKAAARNSITLVIAMLELGADVNGTDGRGVNSLMMACESENEGMIDILINNGALINTKLDGINNILAKCIKGNKLTSFKLLLSIGADFSSIEYLITDPQTPLGNIMEKHKSGLLKTMEENVLSQLGPHVKIKNLIMPPRVLSLFEVVDNRVEVTFRSNIPPIIDNHCNLLFLVTGLLQGSTMKCFISDANRITSVLLNGIRQQSLVSGKYISVTSFSPIQDESNKIVVHFEQEKCRKVRLVLVAYNVMITD